MTEPTPTQGRPRRRASRQAGPVDEHDLLGRSHGGEPAAGQAARAGVDAGPDATVQAVRDSAGTDGAVTAAAADDKVAKDKVAKDKVAKDKVAKDKVEKADKAEKVEASGQSTVKLADADSTAKSDAADDPAATTDAQGSADRKSERRLRPLECVAAAVAIVSLIVLVGSGGFSVYHQRHTDSLADQRAEYIQTAKQAILNLTNIKDDTAKQDIDRVLSVASGDLKAEYSQQKDAYAQVVQQAKVKASGEVIEAAIESQGADFAQVLVAAKQTLTNAGDQQPQDRYYRFRVTVNRGDGGVTASKVEFVA